MLEIIYGVFPDYTRRHLRRITPPELKNINMARDQPRKQVSEIADTARPDMSANTDDSEEGTKVAPSYEIKTDLEYTKTLKIGKEYDQFWERFDNATWSSINYNDSIQVSLILPVTIKVRPDNETATVEIDKDLLNKLMGEKQKQNKTKVSLLFFLLLPQYLSWCFLPQL